MQPFQPQPGQVLTAEYLRRAARFSQHTPTLSGQFTAPALGTGGMLTMDVHTSGRLVVCELSLTFGTGGGGGNGFYFVSLPYPAAARPGAAVGTAHFLRATPPTTRIAAIRLWDHQRVKFTMTSDDTNVGHAIPWVWTSGDRIDGHVTYLAA